MCFLKSTVGRNGKNNREDVQIIQWLLNKAQNGYKFMSIYTPNTPNTIGIEENGVMDTSTLLAIDDWVRFCDKKSGESITSHKTLFACENNYYRKLIFGVVLKSSANVFKNHSNNYNDPRVKQALDGRINFEQFKFILEQAKGKMLTDLGRQMQQYLENPKVLAFLDVVAWAEGTDNNITDGLRTGYDIKYGGTIDKPKYVSDLYNHPGIAAGRYQAVTITWNEAKEKLGLYDFTKESQEIFGVYTLHTKRKGLLQAVQEDRIADAIEIGSAEWASFPNRATSLEAGGDVNSKPTSELKYQNGAKKGQYQPAKSLNEILQVYNTSLRNYQKQEIE